MNAKLGWLAAGVLAVLGCVRTNDAAVKPPVAAPAPQAEATSQFCAAVGGTEAGKNDLVVLFYKRPGKGAKDEPAEHITMAVYKPAPGDINNPHYRLHTVRDVSWDVQLMDLNGAAAGDSPSVKDVIKLVNGK